jgi:hypothetical protein
MIDAFKTKIIERDVRGVTVCVRSMTMAEAIAHQDRVKSDDPEAMYKAAALLCQLENGHPLFDTPQEAADCDHRVMQEIVGMVMEAQGDADVPLP